MREAMPTKEEVHLPPIAKGTGRMGLGLERLGHRVLGFRACGFNFRMGLLWSSGPRIPIFNAEGLSLPKP